MDELELEKTGNYHAWIPSPVLYNAELPDKAKLLFAVISGHTYVRGYCFASNAYLMKLLDIGERTLQRNLKELEKLGVIRIEDGDGGSKQRRIYAGINPLLQTPAKNDGGAPPKMTGAPAKNDGENNKEIKKENKNPPKAPQGAARENRKMPVWKPERFEKFWEYYPRQQDGSKPARARAVKAWDKLRPDDTTIDRMATALRRQKASEQWQRFIGIPYASSWLNARRWEDEYEEPEAMPEDETDGGDQGGYLWV